MRDFVKIVENLEDFDYVWHRTSKETAQKLIEFGIDPAQSNGVFGHGFYVDTSPGSGTEEEDVVLEYKVNDDIRLLDLSNEHDFRIWREAYIRKVSDPNLWKELVHDGIDGVYDDSVDSICFFNPKALKFKRVYYGVINDPLSQTDTNQLDEFALGGLQRCTAVTINALLKDFKLAPIRLNEVPVDHPGVLDILTAKGLAYKPAMGAVGRTLQQFVNSHPLYDWYLLTPGHAMALIRGELFDAENKGPDGRKLEAAFQITKR